MFRLRLRLYRGLRFCLRFCLRAGLCRRRRLRDLRGECHLFQTGQRLARIHRDQIRVRTKHLLHFTGGQLRFVFHIHAANFPQQIIHINTDAGTDDQNQRQDHTKGDQYDTLPSAGFLFFFIFHVSPYFLVFDLMSITSHSALEYLLILPVSTSACQVLTIKFSTFRPKREKISLSGDATGSTRVTVFSCSIPVDVTGAQATIQTANRTAIITTSVFINSPHFFMRRQLLFSSTPLLYHSHILSQGTNDYSSDTVCNALMTKM